MFERWDGRDCWWLFLKAMYVGADTQDNEEENIPFFLGPACSKRVEGNEQGRLLSAGD